MSIESQEKQLFSRWRKERAYPYFIEDGLFCEEEWNKQRIKILYVLKEADWEESDLDLCEYLLSEKSSTYWKTWNNITRWTQAIREGGEYPADINKADKTTCLKTIAAINIKKVGGGAQANDEEIRQYGERDAKFIKEQIELYQPDVIICCGRGNGKNADILYNYVFENTSKWQALIKSYSFEYNYNYYLAYLESGKKVPVVSFRHPQIRGNHSTFKKYYDDMLALSLELKKRKLI